MTDLERLKDVYNEIDGLIAKGVSSSDPEFVAWKTKTERTLIKMYGTDSYEQEQFKNTHFSLSLYALGTPHSRFVEACACGLRKTKAVLETYIKDNEEDGNSRAIEDITNRAYDKIFIVHGHDGEIKEAIARLIERQNIKPIILSEQANKGKTIIEKFEENSDVSCAICLFTADDLGKANADKEYRQRARQNVVFEAGYFIGKLQRENVVIVADQNVEIPSDMSGIVYVNRDNWKFDVLKELRAMGFAIDYNRLDE